MKKNVKKKKSESKDLTGLLNCHYDALVDIKDLKTNPENPNRHDPDSILSMAEILKYQGWREAIRINKQTGVMQNGHKRRRAALANGWAWVPVVYQNYGSEEQAYADLIGDNATGQRSKLDFAHINETIGNYGPDINLKFLGIKGFEIDVSEKEPPKEKEKCPHCGQTIRGKK